MTTRQRVRAQRSGAGIPLPALYFLSGIPALIYQTVWQRLLVLHSGVGTVSIAVIVSVYMLGLGLGSLLGAWISRRLDPARSLLCFAVAELTIGLCAVISPWLLYDIMYTQYGSLYSNLWRAGLLHTSLLILPTTLMGLTLPLMTRALVTHSRTATLVIGNLYGLNTLGAACGALLAPWFLMPLVGVQGALMTGAGLNIVIAAFVFWARSRDAAILQSSAFKTQVTTHRSASGGTSSSETLHTQSDDSAVTQLRALHDVESAKRASFNSHELSAESAETVAFRTWAVLYFLSGLCAIGLEIVWFRILDIAVKSTAYTFGTVLATFLGCMAFGSLAGARRASRAEQPLKSFLAVQCVIMILAGGIILLLARLPMDMPGYQWFVQYWAAEEPLRPSLEQLTPTLLLYVVLPVMLMGLPTALMGYSFCLLQKGVQRDPAVSGYRTGLLQTANIAGCTLGSLLAGTWLLGAVGSMTTLKIFLASAIVFGVIGLKLSAKKRSFGSLVLAAGVVIAAIPNNEAFWRRFHGQAESSGALVAEDVTGVCLLTPHPNGTNWWMWAGGKTQSLLPFGGFHTKLGVMPVTLHAAPKSIAIIGLGSGDTAWGAGCRDVTDSIRVFEICTPEVTLLRTEHARNLWPQVRQLLDDPRIRIDELDARFALMTEEHTYDIIEADAIRHHGAFAGYLYSVEFFQLCSKRLNPGGYMCSWSPTALVHTTFRRAFPHVLELEDGLLLIGSNEPIEWSPEEWTTRIQAASLYLPESVTSDCLNSVGGARQAASSHAGDFVNTDLFPYDEFN
jgi:spermidine synthase